MIGTDWSLLRGSAREKLQMIRPERVQTCITSPPYWALRDYSCPEEEWADGWTGQLGLEEDPWTYIEHLCECFDAVHRVLRKDGTLWIVIGDTYARRGLSSGQKIGEKNTLGTNSTSGYHNPAKYARGTATGIRKMAPGLKQGDLVGIPWMLAFALRDRGWYLRQEVIWNKPNAMPESVRSRCTRSHEQIFMFSKSSKYFYDHEAVKEDAVSDHPSGNGFVRPQQISRGGRGKTEQWEVARKRNRRSVWNVRTRQFPGAHFAVFPHDIVEPCLLAGTSDHSCRVCGSPYARVTERVESGWDGSTYGERAVDATGGAISGGTQKSTLGSSGGRQTAQTVTVGWEPTCEHDDDTGRQTVLDPFAGTGTVGEVAAKHNRRFIGVELNPEYADMAETHLKEAYSMVGSSA